MIQYVALLRGINVGGKGLIKMADLRVEFERLGFQSVRTYIQSGNVLFQAEETDKLKLEKKIEKALLAKFKVTTRVMLRSKREMAQVIAHFPKIFENQEWKHNVIFLSSAIDNASIVKKFNIKEEIEEVHYFKGVLFWSARMDGITRSTMLKLSTRAEYQEMTVRNINTTKKIVELMND